MTVAENSLRLRQQLPHLSVAELERTVREHNARYWNEHQPEIDDPTFDVLVESLRDRAPNAPILQELSGEKKPRIGFAEVSHQQPMLSLEKCYDDQTLLKWATTFDGSTMVTPKIDGVACSLRYNDQGRLVLAATRGDGKKGDDITQNVRGIIDIPQHVQLPASSVGIEVRGEIYMCISRFNAHYKGEKSNPRNLAAGAVKTKDPNESAKYGLSFFAYDLLDGNCQSEFEKRVSLGKLGFPIPPGELVESKAELPEMFRRFIDICSTMDAETDGVVMKANLVSEQERLGLTAHHPRAAIAYKFQGESAHTVVRDIEWGVARTGTLTPVAVVDPIYVSGVTVTRVSLHNAGYAQKLGIGIGARVEIVRRGGVIPHVEKVLSAPDNPLDIPTTWPGMHGEIAVEMNGDFALLSKPEENQDVVVSRVAHFTKVTDMTGFGEKRLTQLIEKGIVKSPADIFRLTKEALVSLERMGEQSALNLLEQVEDKRKLPLAVFLTALGIDELGPTLAEMLVAQMHTMEQIRKATSEDFIKIHGVGEQIATSLVRGFKLLAVEIDELLKEVTIVTTVPVQRSGSIFFGKRVAFTGTMALMERKIAQKRVQALGGKTPVSVTADLDYLVIGDEGSALIGDGEKSTKQKTAEKIQAKGGTIRIISESDFIKMLAE
jgi:DNA ligase (NAD+)